MNADHRDVLRLEPARFYWAVLDTAGREHSLLGHRRRREQLGYQFEEVLPVPIEGVHAVYLPVSGTQVLACGMGRDELRRLATPEIFAVLPAALPEFVTAKLGGLPVDLDCLNLLTQEFLPRPVRRLNRRTLGVAAAAFMLGLALILAGLERRASWHEGRRRALQDRTSEVYAQVLGPTTAGSQPPSARLSSELRGLRQTRGARPAASVSRDVVGSFAALLAAWPKDARARGDTLIITGNSMSLTASVGSHDQARSLADAVGTLPGWKAEQPQVTSQRDGVRVALRYQPFAPETAERHHSPSSDQPPEASP